MVEKTTYCTSIVSSGFKKLQKSPKNGAFILGLEIPRDKLADKETVFAHRNQRVDEVTPFPTPAAYSHDQKAYGQQQTKGSGKFLIVQSCPDVICSGNGKAKCSGRGFPVDRERKIFPCLLRVDQRRNSAAK